MSKTLAAKSDGLNAKAGKFGTLEVKRASKAGSFFRMPLIEVLAGIRNERTVRRERTAEICVKRGDECLEEGRYGRAISYFEEAIRRNLKLAPEITPKLVEAYNGRGDELYNVSGDTYSMKQRYNLVIKYFEEAKGLDPMRAAEMDAKIADAYDKLGNLYYSRKAYWEALRCYKKVKELNPKLATRMNEKCARVLECLGDKVYNGYPWWMLKTERYYHAKAAAFYKKAMELVEKSASYDSYFQRYRKCWRAMVLEAGEGWNGSKNYIGYYLLVEGDHAHLRYLEGELDRTKSYLDSML